ncbi:MAG: hypothetical protein PVI97_02085 [Candidatus Thiodiazotropha sp.]|jgi:hypothetical protein
MIGKSKTLPLSLFMALTIFSACNMDDALTSNHFDPQTWKAMHGSLVIQNPRTKMVEDLKTNYLKTGMSQSEVETLLGKADRIKSHQYLYRLGMRKFSDDYSYLTLIYDDHGKLKEIRYARS